uniref:BTB domain-containing protein n=2 Tax=Biomphalaria glabrata TaxID=6526 RepID=A0A2C9L3V2_BIOGL
MIQFELDLNENHLKMSGGDSVPLQNISKGITQSINEYMNNYDNLDLEINIDGERIRCNSFILASCSKFFRSLLRPNSKEKLESTIDLQTIPLNIFHLVLKTLYTGCDLLTKDNVLDVWSAVHQLQIDFLVQHCEDFTLENISLETLEIYKKKAEILQSKRVSEGIFKYMLEHFMTLRSTEAFLRLEFEDLLKLIDSNGLVVTSEDLVLHSVYEWIKFGEILTSTVRNDNSSVTTSSKDISVTEVIAHAPKLEDLCLDIKAMNVSTGNVNELKEATEECKFIDASNSFLTQTSVISSANQKEEAPSAPTHQIENQRNVHLLPLLKASRYFLLSEASIANLYRKKEIQNNTQIIQFLFESLAFKKSLHINGYLPTAAFHRDCSPFENVGVVCCGNKMVAYSFAQDSLLQYVRNADVIIMNLQILNNQLYVLANYMSTSEMFCFGNQISVSVLKMAEHTCFSLQHDCSIYIITTPNSLVYRYQPISTGCKVDFDIGPVDFAISFYQDILLFKKETLKTKVRCWDTDKNSLSHLIDLEFSANCMTSFTDDRATYILDRLGRLYEVKQYETIQFTFIERLWSFSCKEINGSVLFRNNLIVCGRFPEEERDINKKPSPFSSLSFLEIPDVNWSSNFITFAVSKRDLYIF